ncbi:AMP-binding protein [Micromonospora sp. NPDC049047]|uniref:condensation domain-containing protein n=1 Tax=Micromonospora sp. NPDC049047 TaxID=3155645 RepID=UPI0033E7AEE3
MTSKVVLPDLGATASMIDVELPSGDSRAATSFNLAASAVEVVSAAWADVLDDDTYTADDDFFALGGDSIAAAGIARRVGDALGLQVPILALHQRPTFSAFVGYLESLREPAAVLTPRPDPTVHPLGPDQQRLWLLHQLQPTDLSYNVPMILELIGDLDRSALAGALTAIVGRHEPLRSVVLDATTVRVLPPAPVPVPVAAAADESDADSLATEFLRRPFALAAQPPFRVMLIELEAQRHWLVLSIHHIATDGDSLAIIRHELSRLYNAAATAGEADLHPLTAGYGDIAAWRIGRDDDGLPDRLGRQVARLRGAQGRPISLEPSGEAGAVTSARQTRWLGPGLTEAVRVLAHTRRTTVFVTLLAAFAEIAARWSGGDDVCVGYPVSVREPTAARELVGFFITTRVLRVDLDGRPSFESVVDQTHGAFVAAAADAVPFDALGEAVAAERGHRGPLFQIWFNHLGDAERPPQLHGLRTSIRDAAVPPAIFDLNVYVTEHDDDIRIDLVHQLPRCSTETASELLDQYTTVLAAALDEPVAPLRAHRPDTPRSLRLPDPTDALLIPAAPHLGVRLARVARANPDGVAIRDAAGVHSYAQLRGEVRAAATALHDAGVRPGDTVAVSADRTCALVTAMLAVWASGGRLLLLDPSYPVARLARYVARGGARCLIRTGPSRLDLSTEALVALHHDAPPEVHRTSPAGGGPANGAYLAFTSGSTGTPLGVVGDFGPLEHFLQWYAAEHEMTATDRFALLAGVSHDPVFRDVLLPLWTGATLCVPAPDTYRSPDELAGWLREERVTVVHLTPPLARLLADTGVELPDVRLLCLAGDAVTAVDVAQLARLAPAAVLLNGYGTTETPQLVSRHVLKVGAPVALGATAPGSQLLVVDPTGARCGIGEPGAIVVRSRHLAALLSDPDRGADGESGPEPLEARDTDRPAEEVPGVGRFVTGDVGRYRTDGTVAYLGRADETVNVRGFRAATAETDAELLGDHRVSGAATVAHDGPDGPELVSYVVAEGATPVELRSRLARSLPGYLLPTRIVIVDRLPLTVNGKVDRAALRERPLSAPTEVGRVSATADNSMEDRLAKLWSIVLGQEHVDVTDNFFDLGGTSLSMLRLHTLIRRELQQPIPLLALYQNPTVRALARSLTVDPAPAPAAAQARASRQREQGKRIAARRSHAAYERETR